jgi:hypothetical protein
MSQFTYQAKEHIAVTFYDSENNVGIPFIFQPYHPVTGKLWETVEEAQAWAEEYSLVLVERERKAAEEAAAAAEAEANAETNDQEV